MKHHVDSGTMKNPGKTSPTADMQHAQLRHMSFLGNKRATELQVNLRHMSSGNLCTIWYTYLRDVCGESRDRILWDKGLVLTLRENMTALYTIA